MKKFKTEIVCVIMLGISILCGIQFKANQEENAAKAFHGGEYITLMHQQGLETAMDRVHADLKMAENQAEKNGLIHMLRVLPMLEEK